MRLSKIQLSAIVLIFISSQGWSDCPKPSSVIFKCSNKHCAWTAPWYQGFQDAYAKPNMQAGALIRVFWGAKNNKLPHPGEVGSTICFYRNPRSDQLIELVQNRWGGVLYPMERNWGPGNFQNYPGRECPKNASSFADTSVCHFNYP